MPCIVTDAYNQSSIVKGLVLTSFSDYEISLEIDVEVEALQVTKKPSVSCFNSAQGLSRQQDIKDI